MLDIQMVHDQAEEGRSRRKRGRSSGSSQAITVAHDGRQMNPALGLAEGEAGNMQHPAGDR